MSGVFNIVIGIALIAAGLSGKFALFGTNSPKALAAVGLIPLIIGIVQIVKKHNRQHID